MNKFAGNLPQTFMSFSCLEKKTKLHVRRQSEESQQLVIFPLDSDAETVKILETDTSSVKPIVALQSTGAGANVGEQLTQEPNNPADLAEVVEIPT